MASVNKHDLGEEMLRKMYVDEMQSITMISRTLMIPMSTIRFWLIRFNLLRSRADGIRVAATQGRLGKHLLGKKRVFSESWKANMRRAAQHRGAYAKGVSTKPNGYVEYTTGEHKGRSVHVVLMEQAIQRRLLENEVVHHVDHNRSNNSTDNLQLMTRSEHASIHATENVNFREREANGQFK